MLPSTLFILLLFRTVYSEFSSSGVISFKSHVIPFKIIDSPFVFSTSQTKSFHYLKDLALPRTYSLFAPTYPVFYHLSKFVLATHGLLAFPHMCCALSEEAFVLTDRFLCLEHCFLDVYMAIPLSSFKSAQILLSSEAHSDHPT